MLTARFSGLAYGVFFLAVAMGPQLVVNAAELDEAEFLRLHQLLRPDPGEAWSTIPWRTSLLDAQRLAAAEHKLIFIWSMDGHPLGCT